MVTGVPVPQGFVSVQVMLPPVGLQFTNIEFVPCPDVMDAPPGTVHK